MIVQNKNVKLVYIFKFTTENFLFLRCSAQWEELFSTFYLNVSCIYIVVPLSVCIQIMNYMCVVQALHCSGVVATLIFGGHFFIDTELTRADLTLNAIATGRRRLT